MDGCVLDQKYGFDLGFGDWMLFALPLSVVMLLMSWLYLTCIAFPVRTVELPVATPPNAIVFSSRCIHIPQMARAGFWMNLMGVLFITAFVYLWTELLPAPTGIFNL